VASTVTDAAAVVVTNNADRRAAWPAVQAKTRLLRIIYVDEIKLWFPVFDIMRYLETKVASRLQ
jgi:hypothetical protein